MGVYDEVFVGEPKRYYRFEIYRKRTEIDEDSAVRSEWVRTPPTTIRVDNPPGQHHRMIRGWLPFEPEWSQDSSEITVHFFDTALVMRTSMPSSASAIPINSGAADIEEDDLQPDLPLYDLHIRMLPSKPESHAAD